MFGTNDGLHPGTQEYLFHSQNIVDEMPDSDLKLMAQIMVHNSHAIAIEIAEMKRVFLEGTKKPTDRTNTTRKSTKQPSEGPDEAVE